MRIGLCMIVRNEAAALDACLGDVAHRFDQVAVLDGASTDGTRDVLARHGIVPRVTDLDPGAHGFDTLRNLAAAPLTTPWILHLDADERIAPDDVDLLLETPDPPDAHALALRWTNHVCGPPFDDYKCALVRRGVRFVGRVHENVQVWLRDTGRRAAPGPDVVLHHRPDPTRAPAKLDRYRRGLVDALAADPGFVRYAWFLGLLALREGKTADATRWLRRTVASRSRRFPVEVLDAAVVLATLSPPAAAREVLAWARRFRDTVSDDFEVGLNPWLGPWLDDADRRLDDGRPLVAPRFAS